MTGSVFSTVLVYPNYKSGHFIQWEVDPRAKFHGPINFTVETSENEDFTEILFSKNVGNNYFAIDNSNLKQTLSFNYIYRIKLTTGNNRTFYSRPVWLHSTPDTKEKFQKACEIMRIEQYVTQRKCGRRVFFFKRRGFGEVDPTAVDPVTGAVIADNSSNQGTQFKKGFYPPVLTSFRILTSDESRDFDLGGKGTIEPYVYVAKMIGFPAVNQGDVFVGADDSKRYLVDKVKTFAQPGSNYVHTQRLNLSGIPPTDPLYKMDIPILPQE